MYYFAELDSLNVAVNIHEYSQELTNPSSNFISISKEEKDSVKWSKYVNGQWSVDKFIPIVPLPKPTLEEQVSQLQQDNLILMDALAMTFEEVMMLRMEIGGTV